jgi:3'(2'), 5'-bisphosphate nucleotidase
MNQPEFFHVSLPMASGELTLSVPALCQLAREAGKAILTVYDTAFQVNQKDDASPVTAADTVAEGIILQGLAELAPDIPVVSEEAASAGIVPQVGPCFWLVDPLDGTREFIQRNGEFTVNIALIDHGKPVFGIVYVPVHRQLFVGGRDLGAWMEDDLGCRRVQCRLPPEDGITVVSSRSHGDADALQAFLAPRRVAYTTTAGSSLKLCLVAAGEADLYPRLGPTMEWDIAAGHAVVVAAGGEVLTLDDRSLSYGKPGFRNPHFYVRGLNR